MYLKIGSYQCDSNTTLVQSHVEPLWAGGQIYAHRHILDIEGYLSAATPEALTTAEVLFKTAVKKPRQDIILYHDDGSETAIRLKNQGSLTGVMVTRGPEFTRTQGPEYVTERHFTFSAEAEYPVNRATILLLEWTETIRVGGGFPLYLHRPALNGPPQKQLLYQQMPYTASQTGRAKGYLQYPTPPPPLWPFALKQAPLFEQTSPDRRAPGSYSGWLTTWSYEFESASSLTGSPNLWK